MKLLLRWLIGALAVIATAYIVPGISVANFWTALVVALVIGLINALVRPLLLLLTLPINILTLGLFTLVINAFLFWFVSTIVKGFDVSTVTAAFLGSLVFWLIAWLVNGLFGTSK